MVRSQRILLGLFLVGSIAAARAETPAFQAVYVDVCVAEQDVNRVMEKVHAPVMAVLESLPGRRNIGSAATHGMAQFQIQFKDGATRNDRAGVEEALKRIAFPADVDILSARVELGQPRDDGIFVGRLACGEHRRPHMLPDPRRDPRP